jgi:phenylacetate-CoA ligase
MVGIPKGAGMRFNEGISEFITGRVTFPLSNQLMNRKNIISTYRELARSEWQPDKAIERIRLTRLRNLIAYANRWVPYYRDVFRRIGLEPGDIKSMEDLESIPPLLREEVAGQRHLMVDSRFHLSAVKADSSKRGPAEPIPFALFRRHRLVRNTSSGSTGAPTVFYEDGSRTALNWAHELRLKGWYGVKPGAREARMVRLSTTSLTRGLTRELRSFLWNQLILPGVNLGDDDYAQCAAKLEAYRPKVLWGFTSALTGLASYLRRSGIDPSAWGIKVIVGWAAPVYEHERMILEEVFSCPVANIYSAREVGHIAGLCPHGSFHVNQEYLHVETDRSLVGNSGAERGELLVTTLDISPMPFIRYRMGDLGEITRSRCACGRSLQVLKELHGRTGEVFTTRDGRMISPNFWCRTFMENGLAETVKRFQVVYKGRDALTVRVVRNSNYTGEMETYLRNHLQENFHPGFRVGFEYVENIEPQISGKYQMVIHET